jgi:serine protease
MFLKLIVSAVAASALLFSGIAPASSQPSNDSSGYVSGIILQYSKGVNPIARNGEPTGANLIKTAVSSEGLGGNLYTLKFSSAISKSAAKSWTKRMVLDNRIDWAELNFEVQPASVLPKSFSTPIVQKARAASAPRSLRAKSAIISSAPTRARVRLTWQRPASRYGAQIVGYQIQYSVNGGTSYRTLIRDTESDETKVFLSNGIRAGVDYRFRVRAITNDGSEANTVGQVSNSVSAFIRTSPKPLYITSSNLIGSGNVSYVSQSRSDRGGYKLSQVRYRAVATAVDIESVESSICNETRCRFTSLIEGIEYEVEVFATNPRGTSSSKDVEIVNDFYFPLQWYLSGRYGISAPSAWNYAKGSFDKIVAVIDTGIKPHQQLENKLTKNADGSIYGYDFVSDLTSAADGDGEDSDPTDMGGDASGQSSYHGTQVAGIIAAEHDFIGTAGVAPGIRILPIRALGRDPGTIADLVKAINWAAGVEIPGIPKNRFPVSVINLSLGAKEAVACDGGYQSVFKNATDRGITVVVAAGNESRGSLSFPANCEGVITVVASQALGDKASYSNFGFGAFISAPGGDTTTGSTESPDSRGAIIATWVDQTDLPNYLLAEGTSMAAPVVSGIVALMYSMIPNIKPTNVKSIITASARAFAPGSVCATTGGCGSGIINAQHALALTSFLR